MVSIALTCSTNGTADISQTRYWNALVQFGNACGIKVAPFILPQYADEDYAAWCMEHFDGFLFTGGVDLDPVLYGETNDADLSKDISPARDAFELVLGKAVLASGKPAFGICRGIQSMNVAAGGSLWQDIHSQFCSGEHCTKDENGATHHMVHVNGRLAQILGTDMVETNSYHHQSLKIVPAGADILAHAHDGIVEAFALRTHPYYFAVQWHPELNPDWVSEKLFTDFIRTVETLKK
ncbi:MAG: gamma-glutamyl-gamma-aminobutyrate hydrolase family protein [Clostridia bacterium]|nr:gamma-glutamyl-gamma-aminobutyrate hydrolase family protein [Clostridia bacterium]